MPYIPEDAGAPPTQDELRLDGQHIPTPAEIAERAAAIRETWKHKNAIELADHDSDLHPPARDARAKDPGIRIIDTSNLWR